MIYVTNFGRVDGSGHIFIEILVDASAADLHSSADLGKATVVLDKYLEKFSGAAIHGQMTDLIEQEFKEYLRDVMFSHYFDPVSINNFLYDLRNIFIKFKLNILLAGYKVTYEFKNYIEGDEEI